MVNSQYLQLLDDSVATSLFLFTPKVSGDVFIEQLLFTTQYDGKLNFSLIGLYLQLLDDSVATSSYPFYVVSFW